MGEKHVDLAEKLLELHVQHELDALTSARFLSDISSEVDSLFGFFQRMTLRDLVSPQQIEQVIYRNVVALEIHGGIPELAGEMAAKVRAAPVQQQTRLKDLLSRSQAGEFIDEALTLRRQRESLTEHLLEHPLYRELVAELVYQGIVNYLNDESLLSKNVPGISATVKLGRRMFNKAGLDGTLEKNLKAYIKKMLPFLVRQSQAFVSGALTDEELKDSATTIWSMVENKTLAELQTGLGEFELHEFVVLGYEFWQRFRKTDYFKGCYEAVVSHLFDKYGEQPLACLIDDMGVTPALVKTEIKAFAPALLEALRKEGYLEQMLRRRLASFYHSAEAINLLEKNTAAAKPKPKKE